MNLPEDFRIDTACLAGCFRNTSATYKFYWFLALLAEAEKGREKIDKISLFAHMVAHAWYTVNYFKISFGSADKLERAISRIRELEGLAVDASPAEIHRALVQSQLKETKQELRHFDINVPHKFLSPWLGSGAKGTVYELSQHGYNQPPYALYDDHILLQPAWVAYFKRYAGILRGFCFWHLTLFLQVRNPNVPDIPNKLMRPERRGSLSTHKTRFWDVVVMELGGVNCIYTGGLEWGFMPWSTSSRSNSSRTTKCGTSFPPTPALTAASATACRSSIGILRTSMPPARGGGHRQGGPSQESLPRGLPASVQNP